MSINETKIVDIISLNEDGNQVFLTVCDHLDFEAEKEHLLLLQEKINAYCAFIDSGDIYTAYPDAIGRRPVISIKAMVEPSSGMLTFLAAAKDSLEQAGYGFQYEHTPLKD